MGLTPGARGMETLDALRRALLRGLRLVLLGALTLAPLLVTLWLASLLFQVVASIGRLFLGPLAGAGVASGDIHPLVQVLVALAVLAIVGALASSSGGRALGASADRLIDQVPGVKIVYRGVQRILGSFGTDGEDNRKVVLIEFPSRDMKAIGLVTRRFTARDTGGELAAVYVPTTPNPSSGYIEIVPVERLVWLDWSAQDAIQFIMSGGVIGPDGIDFEAASTEPPPRTGPRTDR